MIGHNVVLHGCVIGGNSLVGMGAIVLNGARIGRNCLLGAGALVTEGKEFPDNSLILGAPARGAHGRRGGEGGDHVWRRHLCAAVAAICKGLRRIG